MERWPSPTLVVVAWGALNTLFAVLLAGFTAAGADGSAGRGGGALGFAFSSSRTLSRKDAAAESVPKKAAAPSRASATPACACSGVSVMRAPLPGARRYIPGARLRLRQLPSGQAGRA